MTKSLFNEKLEIDDYDKRIIELFQKNPDITHSEIAEEINKSQQVVGARILKLERKHLLTKQMGINLKEVDLKVTIIQIFARNVEEMIKRIKNCAFVNYIFKVSGEYNLMIFMAASNLEKIERVVDLWLRNDKNVSSVKTHYVISAENDFILPINFQIEKMDQVSCGPIDNIVQLET